MADKLTVPVTNIGLDVLMGEYGVMPTEKLGDLRGVDGIEIKINNVKYAPVNGDGFETSVPTTKAIQPTNVEVYMNNKYSTLHDKVYNEDVSSTKFYCSLLIKYPKNEVNSEYVDVWFNGYISALKLSGGSEAEAQYFTFEFTATSKPFSTDTTTGDDTTDE